MALWSETFPGADTLLIDNPAATDRTWVMVRPITGQDAVLSGNNGLRQLTPLANNDLAIFGAQKSEFDAGILKFTAARVNASDPTSWLYGVHFNTKQGGLAVGNNSGYAVLVASRTGRVIIFRIDAGSGSVSFTLLQQSSAGAVAQGNQIEVRWGPRAIDAPTGTPEANRINVYVAGTKVISSDDVAYKVGTCGVCSKDATIDAGSGVNFLSAFSFQDFLHRIADYGRDDDVFTSPQVNGNKYKDTPGRLYEVSGAHTNDTPIDLRLKGLAAPASVLWEIRQ